LSRSEATYRNPAESVELTRSLGFDTSLRSYSTGVHYTLKFVKLKSPDVFGCCSDLVEGRDNDGS